jgi:PAS domain S-box-containing protein
LYFNTIIYPTKVSDNIMFATKPMDHRDGDLSCMAAYIEHSEILDALSASVAVIDSDCRIREANAAYCRRFGGSRAEIVGRRCHEVSHGFASPCWQNGHECPLRVAAESRQSARVVHRHLNAGDEVCWEEVVATPLFNSEGALCCVVEELRDVGELLHMEQVIEGLKEELNVLRGLVPMCANCKKVRDEGGAWHDVATFITRRSDAAVSHGMCPDCVKEVYPELIGLAEEDEGESDAPGDG